MSDIHKDRNSVSSSEENTGTPESSPSEDIGAPDVSSGEDSGAPGASSIERTGTPDSSQKEKSGNRDAEAKTTYSWVNPKLRQGGSEQTGNNPWSGGSDGNYWRYSDHTGNGEGQGEQHRTEEDADAHQEEGRGDPWSGRGRNDYSDYSAGSSRRDRKGRKNLDQDHRVRRPRRSGRHWATVAAMAVVFGLIAGLVAYGVNYVGNRIHPVYSSASAGENTDTPNHSGKDASDETEKVTASSGTALTPDIASTGKDQEMTVAEVASVAMPSLVTISTMSVEEMQSFFGGTQKYQVQGAGTGVIIGENDSELLIATNNHVIEGATQVSVGFVDESVISAQIKGFDEDHDLAVVAVKLSDISDDTMGQIRVATVGDSDKLVLGQQVVAIGNALGYGQSVTSGYVSALNRSLQLSDGTNTFNSDGLIQTDAAINSGNSGGALLNMKGELVGINEAKRSGNGSQASVDNVGFAIPMAKAEPILEDLMNENTRTRLDDDERGYLGITCADVTSEYSQIYNMPEGVCVTSVVSGGPADQAGIRKGDVITKFDGKSVASYSKLENRLKYYSSGEEVPVVIQRASGSSYKEQTVKVTLGTSDAISSIQNPDSQDQGQDNNSSGMPGTEPGGNGNSGDIFGQIFGY